MIDDRAFCAAQDFLLGTKTWWTTRMYPELRQDYERRAAAASSPPQRVEEVQQLIGGTLLYRFYAWLERNLQRFKYSGRYGLVPYHDQRRAEFEAMLDPSSLPDGLLELDPKCEQPHYTTSVDIHQHPGGVWSDELAGMVYERGARSTTPLMGARHGDLHERLTEFVTRDSKPRHILDMACGFGKSTRPFYRSLPEAQVTGMDLAAPCLKLAAHGAAQDEAHNVHYRQGNAGDTGYEEQSFDLVTSTMLLHELPLKEIDKVFDESYRVLKPGGRMVHLDFYALPDLFRRFIHYTHSRRNNEPFMPPLAETDIKAKLEQKGFTNVQILPFAEDDGVLDPGYTAWRLPWTLIVAER